MHAFRSNKKLKSAESYVLSAEESYHSPAVFFYNVFCQSAVPVRLTDRKDSLSYK